MAQHYPEMLKQLPARAFLTVQRNHGLVRMKGTRSSKLFLILALAGAICVTSGCDYYDKDENNAQSGADKQPEAVSEILLSLNPEQKVTVRLNNAPLPLVAEELSRLAGISLSLNDVQSKQRVTLSVRDASLQAAVKQIFGADIPVTFPPKHTLPTDVCTQALKIPRIDQQPQAGIVGKEENKTSLFPEQLVEKALHDPNPKERISALENIANTSALEPMIVVQTFETALSDPDIAVRKTALTQINKKRIPVSDNLLHEVAVNDADDEIRGRAWIELVDRGDPQVLKEFLPDALSDPNPDIRESAKMQLDKLKREDAN